MRTIVASLIGMVGIVGSANAQRQLERLTHEIEVEPVRVAPVVRTGDGLVHQVGDWVDYGTTRERSCESRLVFDAIGQSGICADGLLFYGTGFCNMFVTNDFTVVDGTDLVAGLNAVELAWYWSCDGLGTERCIVGVFTQESEPCDADSFDYSGWLLDYGTLSCNPGGYYASTVELTSGAWTLPSDGSGSYVFVFAEDVTTDGTIVLASCAQPMLWGTGEDRGDPGAPGTQGPLQLDDLDGDGVHDTVTECETYAFPALCPTELGAAAGFWAGSSDCCGGYADFNGDTVVDSLDFLAFLNAWNDQDPLADCTGEGVVDTSDFLCFLNTWSACQ